MIFYDKSFFDILLASWEFTYYTFVKLVAAVRLINNTYTHTKKNYGFRVIMMNTLFTELFHDHEMNYCSHWI